VQASFIGSSFRSCNSSLSHIADAQIRGLQAKIDAQLQQDGKVNESLRTGAEVLQSVTPIVLGFIGDALDEVGKAHWTLLPLRFVGTAMDMCVAWPLH
jgi:hypothetical protein